MVRTPPAAFKGFAVVVVLPGHEQAYLAGHLHRFTPHVAAHEYFHRARLPSPHSRARPSRGRPCTPLGSHAAKASSRACFSRTRRRSFGVAPQVGQAPGRVGRVSAVGECALFPLSPGSRASANPSLDTTYDILPGKDRGLHPLAGRQAAAPAGGYCLHHALGIVCLGFASPSAGQGFQGYPPP